MNWRHYVREHLPPLNVSAERETEIVDELAVQLETTFDRAQANGATEDEAMRRARAEVPDWQALARTLGRIERPFTQPLAAGASSGGLMTGLIQDLRYAVRALKRAPGFAAVSIVTLALGIAATTIVYSIVDGILLRPLPIQDPDRVMLARETINGQDMSVAWPNFQDWQKRQTSFATLAAWRGLTANLTGIEQPRRLNVRHVTWELLSTLGVGPMLGRDFTADDDRPGVGRTAVVSYAFWQRELGGTPETLGRQIMLDEVPVTVIGVLPRDFTIARQEDVFLPVGSFLEGPVLQMYNGRGNHFGFAAIGRLKPGVTMETANTEMVTIARQLEQEYPATNSGNGASVRPLLEVLVGDARQMLYVLFGAVITMLLIACVNLANLMLSRAAGRTQEMAVRRSLGAARWRIARQMLTESLWLAVIGGSVGVLVAYVGFETLVALLPPNQPRIHIVTIDWRVVFVAALASIGTGVLFGLMPAIQAATGKSMTLLRSARVTGASQSSAGTRRALLLAEVALALVLVTGAGLMLRTMNNLAAVETGFNHEAIVSAQFNVRVGALQGDQILQAYLPVRQVSQGSGAFVVRAAANPAVLGRSIEAAVHEIDPNLPLFNIQTMGAVIDAGIGNERLTMVLLLGFAGLALLMAAIGVFGVTAYSVTQRTHELGVRMALGARPSSVLALVLRQEMGACLIGIVVGIAGAWLLSSLLESLLFGVTSRDTLTLSIASLVLLAVTAVACLIPARRATRVDPVTALRLD